MRARLGSIRYPIFYARYLSCGMNLQVYFFASCAGKPCVLGWVVFATRFFMLGIFPAECGIYIVGDDASASRFLRFFAGCRGRQPLQRKYFPYFFPPVIAASARRRSACEQPRKARLLASRRSAATCNPFSPFHPSGGYFFARRISRHFHCIFFSFPL